MMFVALSGALMMVPWAWTVLAVMSIEFCPFHKVFVAEIEPVSYDESTILANIKMDIRWIFDGYSMDIR